MIVRILGDANRNFDGKLEAQFINNDNEMKELFFNLDKWENIYKNGIIGKDNIKILIPERLYLEFDKEYEINDDNGKKIYEILKSNGWSSTNQFI